MLLHIFGSAFSLIGLLSIIMLALMYSTSNNLFFYFFLALAFTFMFIVFLIVIPEDDP